MNISIILSFTDFELGSCKIFPNFHHSFDLESTFKTSTSTDYPNNYINAGNRLKAWETTDLESTFKTATSTDYPNNCVNACNRPKTWETTKSNIKLTFKWPNRPFSITKTTTSPLKKTMFHSSEYTDFYRPTKTNVNHPETKTTVNHPETNETTTVNNKISTVTVSESPANNIMSDKYNSLENRDKLFSKSSKGATSEREPNIVTLTRVMSSAHRTKQITTAFSWWHCKSERCQRPVTWLVTLRRQRKRHHG